MAAQATDWSVVVVAAWNTAILTPEGIRRRILKLPDATALEIEVNIDQVAPARVRYDGIVIAPNRSRLTISPAALEAQSLLRSSELAKNAITSLPETPYVAVGVNINYHASPVPENLIDLTSVSLDNVLSDSDFEIKKREVRRALDVENGRLNFGLVISENDDSSDITMNFELRSTNPQELISWLEKTKEFVEISEKLMASIRVEVDEHGEG